MKKIIFFISFGFFLQVSAQNTSTVSNPVVDIPCADLKTILGDALNKHHDDKGEKINYNEHTGITQYAYHISLPWALGASIKEMTFDDGKTKSWGEVHVFETGSKEKAVAYADLVKAELKECFKTGVDKTEKAGTEGRDYSFVFMVHNDFSWTDIELFVNHTGEDYHVYIIF